MMFNSPMEIGKSLKKLRESKKLTQIDIAAIVNATDASVSHWENGRYYPEFSKLIALAEYFNMSVVDLITFGQESSDKPSKEELDMIQKYRKAPLNIKQSIKLMLD